MSATAVSPDCGYGKHAACHGDAWDSAADAVTDCTCNCHEPAMDANHVRSLDALARKRDALVPQFDGEPLSTPPSTEYMSNQEKPAERHERPHSA
jgi:hypothetical protein